jgi:hypothetical protein
MNWVRKGLAIASIIIGGTAVGIPDPVISKVMMAAATSLNAAALYLLKEESTAESKE